MKKQLAVIISALLLLCMLLGACGGPGSAIIDTLDTNNVLNNNSDDTLNVTPSDTIPNDTIPADTAPSNTDDKNDDTTVTPAPLKRNEYPLQFFPQYFNLYGRMISGMSGVTCDFTASGIEFCGVMTGDVIVNFSECQQQNTSSTSKNGDIYFTVFIDGVRQSERYKIDSNNKNLKVATFTGENEHTVKIVKQTEAQEAWCTIYSVTVTGKLKNAPLLRDKYIEIIGDSITCGYGVLTDSSVTSDATAGSALYQDGTQAFPFLVAEGLNADCSVIGCSGIGVEKSWNYKECDFYTKTNYYRNKTDTYDFTTARKPDLVIINLGTNDWGAGKNTGTESGFKAEAKKLINLIRSSYGTNVTIIWTLELMGECRGAWVKAVISEMGGASAGLYTFTFTPGTSGGGGHPNVAQQKKAYEDLSKYIKDNNLL